MTDPMDAIVGLLDLRGTLTPERASLVDAGIVRICERDVARRRGSGDETVLRHEIGRGYGWRGPTSI